MLALPRRNDSHEFLELGALERQIDVAEAGPEYEEFMRVISPWEREHLLLSV